VSTLRAKTVEKPLDTPEECQRLRTENERLRQNFEKLKKEYMIISEAYEKNMGYQNSLHRLIKVFQELGNFNVLEELLHYIIGSVTRILDADRSTLFLMDHEKQELFSTIAEGMGGKEIRFPVGKGIAGAVARTKETILIPDAYNDDRFNPDVDKKTGYRTRNILCMAMCNIENKVIGVIQVLNKHHGDFSPDDITLLTGFCTHAAVSLESTILYTQMEQLVAKRTQDLQEALQSNRDILENTRDGMLVVDKVGLIQPGFSDSCKLLLNQQCLENQNLLEFPFEPVRKGDKGVVQQLPSWLEYGWEHPEMENWEELSTQLLELNEKYLDISFQRIYGSDAIKGFMVIVSDATERFQLEKEVEEKRRESAETLVSIMSMIQQGKRDFHQFLSVLEKQFGRLRNALFEPDPNEEHGAPEVFRAYHTLKGLTQTYAIDYMSKALHEEEDQWVDHLESNSFPEGEELQKRQKALEDLEAATARMKQLFIKIYGDPNQQELITIPVQEYGTFLSDFKDLEREDIEFWLSQFQEYSFPWLSKALHRDAEVAARKSSKSFKWKSPKLVQSLPRKQITTLLPIFSHLIRNSIEHGLESEEVRKEAGKEPIGTLSFNFSETASHYTLAFCDDGRGMDPDRIQKRAIEKGLLEEGKEYSTDEIYQVIFQPGFSTKEEVSTQAGRGVGMDAVMFHVSELGGGIRVQSTPGEGTTFYLDLPQEKAELAAKEMEQGPVTRILVLDDNQVMVKLITAFLDDPERFAPKGTSTVTEALELLEQQEFDIVVTDISMPEMSGLDLIPRIYEIQEACRVIIITGYPNEEHLQKIMELGVEEYLVKPFHRDEIINAVENIREKTSRWTRAISR